MRVTVKLGAPLSQVVGESKVVLSLSEGATVSDVFDDLGQRYPDFEAGLRGKGLRWPMEKVLYSLFINARPLPLDRISETSLRDGDRIYLFLPVAGG